MSYSEETDILQHADDVRKMFETLRAAGCQTDDLGLMLDIGGGAGIHSALIAEHARRIFCSDFRDQNARFGGEFVKLLLEKMQRHGLYFPIERLEFHTGDAMRLFYRDGLFDTVVCFNAFEHIPEPSQALDEMLRVLRPGGYLYLTFDPIWTCDSGSHFYWRVPIPWEHLVSDDNAFAALMIGAGAGEDEVREYRVSMNRKRLKHYRELFDGIRDRVDILVEREWPGLSDESNASHPNFAHLLGLGFSQDELLCRGMAKVIRKRMP